MKILFDHAAPFSFAPGGVQVQIEQTKAALIRLGFDVDFLRWWDAEQAGDLIHYFGVPKPSYLSLARRKNLPVVMTHTFSETCNRSSLQLAIQSAITRTLLALPGWGMIKSQLNWQSFRETDRLVVGLDAERRVAREVFGVADEKIASVPLGLHPDFLAAGKPSRSGAHLITTGTITPVKGSVELAELARSAQVPVLFVGKPFHRDDPYWKRFEALIDNRFVLYHDHVSGAAEMIALLQASRGFVLFSRFENWCLSAHEAIACGLPVLVPDLPWSRERFGDQAHYLLPAQTGQNVARLRSFYDEAPKLSAPAIKLYSWDDTATKLAEIYRSLVK